LGSGAARALIDAEAAAFLAERLDRVSVEGPPVLLNPQAYSTMALVVHELVTNSAKYGSLSVTAQRRDPVAPRNDGDLLIDWRERAAPR
jgi:two-component sensor histidine kinase